MNRISRRRFLKIAGFGASAAAVAAATSSGLRAMARRPAAGETRVVPTFCDICFWKCNALAHVRDGRLWKITGHPDDPLSAVGSVRVAPAASALTSTRTACAPR